MTICLNSLTYYYNQDQTKASRGVEHISFRIEPGEVVGLVGPSGAGKSCLLRCLAGVLNPTSGSISISTASESTKVGLILQEPECQFFLSSVYEEVAFALQGRPKTEIDLAVNQVLEQVGYKGDIEQSPFRLSGGQQRRVALASILIMEPDVLLLDEPTVGMDAAGLGFLRKVIAEYRMKKKPVIIVSHDQDFLYQQVGRILVLKDGRLQADFNARDWLTQADLMKECSVDLPELLQLSKRNLPEAVRKYLAQTVLR